MTAGGWLKVNAYHWLSFEIRCDESNQQATLWQSRDLRMI